MKKVLFSLLISASLFAGNDDNATQAAYELLKATNMKKVYNETLITSIKKQEKMLPITLRYDKEFVKDYEKILKDYFNKYMGWELMKEDIVKLYTKYFTAKELQELKEFYSTDLGKKSLKLLPTITAESMQLAQKKLQPHSAELKLKLNKLIAKTIERNKLK